MTPKVKKQSLPWKRWSPCMKNARMSYSKVKQCG